MDGQNTTENYRQLVRQRYIDGICSHKRQDDIGHEAPTSKLSHMVTQIAGKNEFNLSLWCPFKGTVSRDLRWVLLYINRKLFSRAIVAHHTILILLKGHCTINNLQFSDGDNSP